MDGEVYDEVPGLGSSAESQGQRCFVCSDAKGLDEIYITYFNDAFLTVNMRNVKLAFKMLITQNIFTPKLKIYVFDCM